MMMPSALSWLMLLRISAWLGQRCGLCCCKGSLGPLHDAVIFAAALPPEVCPRAAGLRSTEASLGLVATGLSLIKALGWDYTLVQVKVPEGDAGGLRKPARHRERKDRPPQAPEDL